ncbi:MAG: site-2 protease family protein, partial [Actinobacteria bacterium]
AEANDASTLLDAARSITYRSLSLPKRIIVLTAGVFLNLLTAVLVFTVVLSTFGYMADTGRISRVSPSSAAAKAGLVPGDRIVSIGGVKASNFQDLVMVIARYAPGDTVVVKWTHDGSARSATVVLDRNPATRRALLGVSPQMERTRPSPLQAMVLSFGYIGMTAKVIAGLFSPVTFQATVSQSSSVIGAAVYAAKAAKAGPLDYAGIIAALSLSLGVINLVPIPPLDGGKVAVELFERFRGRPLSRRVSLGLSATGAVVLFSLVFYLMYADVVRMLG